VLKAANSYIRAPSVADRAALKLRLLRLGSTKTDLQTEGLSALNVEQLEAIARGDPDAVGVVPDPARQLAAQKGLWRRGRLRWKLERDKNQLGLYDTVRAYPGKRFTVEGARKLGKTFLFGIIALETALQNPGKQINWTAGTKDACEKILVPILEEITRDAPDDFAGKWDEGEGEWVLPNKAKITISSAETKRGCNRARGPSSILNIVDEAGFIDLLEYLLDSVFSPMMRRVKRGASSFMAMTLLCSTSPYVPTHHFCEIADVCARNGGYAKRTIYDSGFETPEEIEQYIADEAAEKGLGVDEFKKTSTFKREFMSERVVDEEKVVFLEFTEARDRVERPLVQDWPRPIGFDRYIYKRTAVDPGGMRDPTGILSGYVDFTNARIVIEGERLMPRPNTKQIAEAIIELETELWGPPPDPQPGQMPPDRERVSRRVDDTTGRVTLDLWEIHKLRAEPATKNDRNASIGLIRTYLRDGTLVIHPRCVELLEQLHTALNNKTKTDFERNAKGHCDLAAALMYFVRDLNLTTNPFPKDFDQFTGRAMPDQHTLMIRREEMGVGRAKQGLAAALLGGNPFVAGQLKKPGSR
jgi:hypothetical protein